MTAYETDSPQQRLAASPADRPVVEAPSNALSGTAPSPAQRHEMIAVNAYFRAEHRGFQAGDPTIDWVEAEAEIDRLFNPPQRAVPQTGEQTREAFQGKLEARLSEWDADIARLKANASKLRRDLRAEYKRQLASLAAKRAEAEQKLNELRQRTEGAWDDLKTGAEKSWEEMRKALDSVAERFQ